MAQKLIYTFY